MTVWGRRALKILFHLVALAGLCLAFMFSLFLGLQVRPLYGSVGIAVTVVLAGLYVYLWGRRTLIHLPALAGLYLAFMFSLFLGLQVRPLYGSIGFAVTVVLAGLYVYFGILRRSRRTKLGKTTGRT